MLMKYNNFKAAKNSMLKGKVLIAISTCIADVFFIKDNKIMTYSFDLFGDYWDKDERLTMPYEDVIKECYEHSAKLNDWFIFFKDDIEKGLINVFDLEDKIKK